MTRSEENYIKAIYHLAKPSTPSVSTNAIADQMQTKPSSVTDMVKKLADKNLIDYRRYQGVRLTAMGRDCALKIIRKHRLWEVFLVEKLQFAWDEVHDIAEQLEHVRSEKLTDSLDRYLGFPSVDPHGDPIPGKNGEMKKSLKIPLQELAVNGEGICVAVKDSSTAFLKFLDKNKIALGNVIRVVDREEFDGSLLIEVQNRTFNISKEIAKNLYVRTE